MLKTCDKEGCCPLEQIRGEMGAGDYHDVIISNRNGRGGSIEGPEKYGTPVRDGEATHEGVRPEHCVEIHDGNKNDFRVCCKTCGRATPWGTQDIPGMPGAGADWTRKKWNATFEA